MVLSMNNDAIVKMQENLKLLDVYGGLLTEKQQDIFRYVYEDDLSFSEIAENLEISKAAVSDTMKRTTAILNEYENKLKIIEKQQKRIELYQLLKQNPEKIEEIVEELIKIDEDI